MMRFTRTLQHKVTETGHCYTLSIPMEVAQDLQIEQGGLCSISVLELPRLGKFVALKAYQDKPLLIMEFNPSFLTEDNASAMIETPLEYPTTKGPSKEITIQGFKPFIAASRLALRVLKMKIDIMMSTPSGRAAMTQAFRQRGFR
jgi:hypothetical protein